MENPYWQLFCSENYLQTELPIDPSSLTRWRKRIGEEGVETLLVASIEAAWCGGVVQKVNAQRVIVDTTVMPKAIAHPTDSRLLNKSRQHLVKAAKDNGHMKMDGCLGRNPLKGALGDALHAVMCGAGHNLLLILAALRLYFARFGLPMPVLIKTLAANISQGGFVR